MDDPLKLLSSESIREIGLLRYQRASLRDYLLLRYWGSVADAATADAWLADLEQALAQSGLSQILWDSTKAEPHSKDVRARILQWAKTTAALRRSAIVVQSDMLRLSANLSGLDQSVTVRGFATIAEADAWLRGG